MACLKPQLGLLIQQELLDRLHVQFPRWYAPGSGKGGGAAGGMSDRHGGRHRPGRLEGRLFTGNATAGQYQTVHYLGY